MSETARLFRDFIRLALEHASSPEVARAFDRTLQFDLEDDAPFYMETRGGQLSVKDGDSGLDWKLRRARRAASKTSCRWPSKRFGTLAPTWPSCRSTS